MLNYELFDKGTQPTEAEIKDFVGTEIFAFYTDLDNHMRERYNIKPKFAYSSCAMDRNIWRGWNIKYQKSGKSFCTIYPQQDYLLVLVPGKHFEVRNAETVGDVKRAVEVRKEEISFKKKAR
ncbi:MAG: DUF3788 domain-containing protein [Oscillospiraceae bacterium]|nr:DUF3788 domain-containing protein [Oscillospiraceae bacterium]